MKTNIEKYKGIHPGKIIDRELKKRKISQRAFANSIGIHGQTLNAIIKGRRSMTIEQSYKLEKELGYEEEFLIVLQAQYDYQEFKRKKENEKYSTRPDIRKILFWDVDFDKIEWGYKKDWIIKRIMERGSEYEKNEITRFYNLNDLDIEKYK
ncbi:MAG: HigA family addiction module antitoxin [Bacteroidales bacterium]|nr:HigA family addiction module antitoxin [Bacteroidales bacterium]